MTDIIICGYQFGRLLHSITDKESSQLIKFEKLNCDPS